MIDFSLPPAASPPSFITERKLILSCKSTVALPRFYSLLDTGKIPSTSQLNEFQYMDFLDALLQKGDALRIAFGSGMTPSGKNAQRAGVPVAGAAVQGTECIHKDCLRRRSGRRLLLPGYFFAPTDPD